ncbi:MAG: YeeE/YedE family protein [Thiogranum sp.]|nr:YeeE/YedE family protein [Thiogranum sp.]
MKYLAIFSSGLLFAVGLGVSGMTLPQKVIGFLDFSGENWDPSLGLVMITSAGVYMLLHRRVLRRPAPLFDTDFHVPARNDIDRPLVFGSMLFGIGWGMVGFCPGPAVTALVSGQTQVWIFFVAMVAGMYAEGTLAVSNRMLTQRGDAVDG